MQVDKKIIINVATILFICVLGFAAWFGFTGMSHDASDGVYEGKRQLRYNLTLQNKSNRILKNVDFWVYGPVNVTATQKVKSLKANVPYLNLNDKLGNNLLHFKFESFPPFATKILNIKAELAVAKIPNKTEITDLALYLKSSLYVETHQPELVRLAKQLKGADNITTARNVLQWIKNNIKHAGYTKGSRGALYAFQSRKGDCTEFMYLYAALMRINGIPARNVGGYVYKEDRVIKPEDYHNWVEIYLDGKWHVIDPYNGKYIVAQEDYLTFHYLDVSTDKNQIPERSQRFAVSDRNIRVKMN